MNVTLFNPSCVATTHFTSLSIYTELFFWLRCGLVCFYTLFWLGMQCYHRSVPPKASHAKPKFGFVWYDSLNWLLPFSVALLAPTILLELLFSVLGQPADLEIACVVTEGLPAPSIALTLIFLVIMYKNVRDAHVGLSTFTPLKIKGTERILHLGYVGRGRVTCALGTLVRDAGSSSTSLGAGAGAGGSVVALEAFHSPRNPLSPAWAVENARRQGLAGVVRVVSHSMLRLPFAQREFDAVVVTQLMRSSEIGNQFTRGDLKLRRAHVVLREAGRVLKPGGRIALQGDSKAEQERMLVEAGFIDARSGPASQKWTIATRDVIDGDQAWVGGACLDDLPLLNTPRPTGVIPDVETPLRLALLACWLAVALLFAAALYWMRANALALLVPHNVPPHSSLTYLLATALSQLPGGLYLTLMRTREAAQERTPVPQLLLLALRVLLPSAFGALLLNTILWAPPLIFFLVARSRLPPPLLALGYALLPLLIIVMLTVLLFVNRRAITQVLAHNDGHRPGSCHGSDDFDFASSSGGCGGGGGSTSSAAPHFLGSRGDTYYALGDGQAAEGGGGGAPGLAYRRGQYSASGNGGSGNGTAGSVGMVPSSAFAGNSSSIDQRA